MSAKKKEYRGIYSREAKRSAKLRQKHNEGTLIKLIERPLSKTNAKKVAAGMRDPRLPGRKSRRVRQHKWVKA